MTDMAFRADLLLQPHAESSGGTQTAGQRESAMRRLASLGELTGGIAHDLRNTSGDRRLRPEARRA